MSFLQGFQAEMSDLIFFLMESMCSRAVIACCLQNPAPFFKISSEVATSELAGIYCRASTVGWYLLLAPIVGLLCSTIHRILHRG